MSIKIIYLLGSGRSGTTALATILSCSADATLLGEMHRFLEYLSEDQKCSCGETLSSCRFWSKVIDRLPEDMVANPERLQELSGLIEAHRGILAHLVRSKRLGGLDEYLGAHQAILVAAQKEAGTPVLIDSAKYIGRALALRHLAGADIKYVYLVRDVRGVVHSFSKKVQTSRGTLAALLYYLLMNLAAALVCATVLRNNSIKIRYEDLADTPLEVLDRLGNFLGIDVGEAKSRIAINETFETGHLIAGNRLRLDQRIVFRADLKWQSDMSVSRQFLLYLGALPVMVLNRYWPFCRRPR